MARIWPLVAVVALFLPGCFSFGFERHDNDFEDDDEWDGPIMFFPMGGFLIFALVVAGVIVLIVNLANQRPPPPPAQPPVPPVQPAPPTESEPDQSKPAPRRR